jgi:hypothetical protein
MHVLSTFDPARYLELRRAAMIVRMTNAVPCRRISMATSTSPLLPQEQAAIASLPPLQNGDHLTREEFERRYDAMPHLKKAELIDGVVYMSSPVNHEKHGKPHFKFGGWIVFYVAGTPGVDGGDNSSLKLDLINQPQPDTFLYVLPSAGGQVRIDAEGYIVTAPDLIGEVSASSASYDLHVKLPMYRRHGVREYVVWRVLDRAVDWFVVRGNQFERLPLASDGCYHSEVFPGLWLDPQALIDGDLAKLQQVVQRGLATPEHQQFVDRLARPPA